NAGSATLEIPPSYPTFGMAYAIKTNIQAQSNILQPAFTSFFDSIPTLHELEAAFAKEKLTVNAIKDLSDEYLREQLGVTKLG
ncbi:7691_t:CDS:2, partial [Cetraspora pellucida]